VQIDTTTANGRLAFGIFATFAEFERELIAECTHPGLAARARGRMGGRPREVDRAPPSRATTVWASHSEAKSVLSRRNWSTSARTPGSLSRRR